MRYLFAASYLLIFWLLAGVAQGSWRRLPRGAQRSLGAVLAYAALLAFGTVFVTPFLWMLSTSLKVDAQIFQSDVRWIPSVPTVHVVGEDSNGIAREMWAPVKRCREQTGDSRVAVLGELEGGRSRVRTLRPDGGAPDERADRIVPTALLQEIRAAAPQWHNYSDALNAFPFLLYTANTLVICLLTTLGTLLSAALPAYGFARLRWKGRDTLFFILIATLMLPPQVTLLPVFLLFRSLHWTGTFLPLVVPSFFGSAFYIFLLRQFFLTVPQELSDAARLDGCSEAAILWRVLAPIARPALATVALFSFTSAWMDFTGPLIYLHDEKNYTLAVGLLAFLGRHSGEWSLLMAAATVMTAPMLVLFFFAQRTYIQGIALTGIKG